MSEPDAVPLPREGQVFFDVRGESRSMRLSWYADSAVAVFSIWQGNRCTGTFRLPFGDLARMVHTLQSGPHPGAAGYGGPGHYQAGHNQAAAGPAEDPDYRYQPVGYQGEYAGAGYEGPGYETPGYAGYDGPGYDGPGYDGPGYDGPGYEDAGYRHGGYAAGGYDDDGYGQPAAYYQDYGDPAADFEGTGRHSAGGHDPDYYEAGQESGRGFERSGGYQSPGYGAAAMSEAGDGGPEELGGYRGARHEDAGYERTGSYHPAAIYQGGYSGATSYSEPGGYPAAGPQDPARQAGPESLPAQARPEGGGLETRTPSRSRRGAAGHARDARQDADWEAATASYPLP
jgi:hypothetical protein